MSRNYKKRVAAALIILQKDKNKRPRTVWVRKWLERRNALGAHRLIGELVTEDPSGFQNFCRLSASNLECLLNLIGPKITKEDTKMRKAISAKDRVLVTLRFLATGDSFKSLTYLFRIADSTISLIVREVCEAIAALKEEFIKLPATPEQWKAIAEDFNEQWHFPHCIGAMDGKHIVMQAPPNSGSYFYNYKHTHSIVLMAVVDANYKVIYADVGANGRISDGGVFRNCSLNTLLESGGLNLPEAIALPGRQRPAPFVVVADAAFAMRENVMKPYPCALQPAPHRIFNYRLSRARRVVENFFGIIAQKFRVLRLPLLVGPEVTEKIVLAVCVLHNFLSDKGNYMSANSYDKEDPVTFEVSSGSWRNEAIPNTYFPLQEGLNNRNTNNAREIRNEFSEFFLTPEGEVPWQYKFI